MDFDFILAFIKAHIYEIVSITIALVSLIVFIVRRRVKITDNVYLSVLLMLPHWIKEAELIYIHPKSGADKFAYVLDKAVQELVRLTGKDAGEVVSRYGRLLDRDIEVILSTPTKNTTKEENDA